jgi:hypothetical protein
MMQLDDFRIPGKNLNVKGNLEIRTEDIAGETSGTDSVEKGTKPKVLRVSVSIPFKTPLDLTAMVKAAEAVSASGERKIYTITNLTANAAGIRQVRFFEQFNWEEADALRMWNVSFSLKEYLSNPERVESRSNGLISATDPTQYKQILANAENLLF